MSGRERYRRLLVRPIERFDQRNGMFRRTRYDPEWIARAGTFYGPTQARDRAGYRQEEVALADAAWYVEDVFAMGCQGSNHEGLYAWESDDAQHDPEPTSLQIELSDPVEITKKVKAAARFLGASLAGVCELDRRWLYARVSDDLTGEHKPLHVPEEYRFAIAMAVEMDYSFMQTSPTAGAAAATGLGYSKMAYVAGLLARFIRNLGYKAIPCGNDTALSIPIAIEAGLGELGRNGLLITEKFGPRVRICKVLTDLPLVPDEVCRVCLKCAKDCPSRAISFGEKTTKALNISTNPGVLKWPVNGEQCFKYWVANGLDCATCIRVCPFNQEPGRLHDLVRAGVKRAPWLDPLLLRLGDAFGYGKQHDPATMWDG